MTSVYQLEPPTSGKVVLKTSMGDIDIELWTVETPKAARNFIQLCLEGYYDNTIFHRLIPKFMIQGGDPTATGKGGQSIYGENFKDEFHQRLKFTHRGLVAMANSNEPNTNGSQFFITFDECPWIDRKHTIFGKVTGDSIYNFMQLQELETDKNDRPLNPPKILKTMVIENPFSDIIVRSDAEIKRAKIGGERNEEGKGKKKDKRDSGDDSDEDDEQDAAEEEFFKKQNALKKQQLEEKKNKKIIEKQKKLKNKNLLSFMDDEGEEDNDDSDKEDGSGNEEENNNKKKKEQFKKPDEKNKKKIMNIHDAAEETERFSKETAVDLKEIQKKKEKQEEEENKKRRLLEKISKVEGRHADKDGDEARNDDDEANSSSKVEMPLLKKRFIEGEDLETRAQLATSNQQLVNYQTRLNKKTGKMEIFWEGQKKEKRKHSSEEESASSTDSEEFLTLEEKQFRQKQKQEYENLKISFLSQKKNGLGTNSAELQTFKSEESKLLSGLEKRKQKFLDDAQRKKHEGSYMEKLQKFQKQLASIDNKNNWVRHELKFQVTGDRAFQDFENREKVREYDINEDVKKKGFQNKLIDNMKRDINNNMQDTSTSGNRHGTEKLSVEDLLKMAEE